MEQSKRSEDIEIIKFLMECSYKEATLFWNRNSVFLLANLATFTAAFAYLTESEEPVGLVLRIGVGAFGMLLSGIWVLVIRAGRQMNHMWTHEAKKLASTIDQPMIENAINGTPSGAVSKDGVPSATGLMYVLAAMFGLAWLSVTLLGNGGLI